MYRHSNNSVECVDDWDARYAVNEALVQLVDDAAMYAEECRSDHSTGEIDREAELTALAEWFGIE